MGASLLQPGVLLSGEYVLEDKLSEASGKVFRAWRQSDARPFVIRIFSDLPPPMAAELQALALSASRVRHPVLASLEAFGQSDELSFLVCEYVQGQRLDRWADEIGIPPLGQIVELTRRLC